MLKNSFVGLILIFSLLHFGCAKPSAGPQSPSGARAQTGPEAPSHGLPGPGRSDPSAARPRLSLFIKAPDLAKLQQAKYPRDLLDKHEGMTVLINNSFELDGPRFKIVADEAEADLVCAGRVIATKTTWPPWRIVRTLISILPQDDFCEWQFTFTAKGIERRGYPRVMAFTVQDRMSMVMALDRMVKAANAIN